MACREPHLNCSCDTCGADVTHSWSEGETWQAGTVRRWLSAIGCPAGHTELETKSRHDMTRPRRAAWSGAGARGFRCRSEANRPWAVARGEDRVSTDSVTSWP